MNGCEVVEEFARAILFKSLVAYIFQVHICD